MKVGDKRRDRGRGEKRRGKVGREGGGGLETEEGE